MYTLFFINAIEAFHLRFYLGEIMLKYFRVAEIGFLVKANGQKAVVQSLLQSAKTA